MSETCILFEDTVRPGATWSHVVKRGTTLRITDVRGGANVGALFYNFDCPVERYNMSDTLKAQHIAKLTKGCVLYSDMGRILCSITDDSVGWHDTLGGCSNPRLVEERYGCRKYQDVLNDCYKNALDGFLIELAKWGLGWRDLVPNVNFFSRVDIASDGAMSFAGGNSKPGDFLELRAEMNVLTILNTCQHPLDPEPAYEPRDVNLSILRSESFVPDDLCRRSWPENSRGFILTERYFQ